MDSNAKHNTIKFTVPADTSDEMKQILTQVYRSLTERAIIRSIRSSVIFSPRTRLISPTIITLAASSASLTVTSFFRSLFVTISLTKSNARG